MELKLYKNKFIGINKYDLFVFDLDDTIYPEIEYLKKAYDLISKNIVNVEKNFVQNQKTIYYYLLNELIANGRQNLFEKLTKKFSLKKYELKDFLNDLRNVKIENDSLEIFPSIKLLIEKLIKMNKIIYIYTNGNKQQQQNKFNSLRIPFKQSLNIIYTSEFGKELEKPNPFLLLKTIKDLNVEYSRAIYVGDSEIDKKTALAAKINYLSITNLLQY